MNDTESIIREYMAKTKIATFQELANRLGMVRQTLANRLKKPETFIACEVIAIAKLFDWTDEDIGKFIGSIRKK